MNNILIYLLYFFIYSIIGWIIEVVNCSILNRKFTMRGFLIGPYCPIYGFGAIFMILLLEKYSGDLLVLFVIGSFIACFIEYIGSFILEKIFNIRWWDYSNKKFNLNGRISLETGFLFGILSIILINYIHPLIDTYLLKLSSDLLYNIVLLTFLIIISDLLLTYNIIKSLKLDIKNIKNDYTGLIDKAIWDKLSEHFYYRKIFESFPKLKIKR